MPDSFTKKRIDVAFSFNQDGFNAGERETLTLEGHKVSCQVMSAGMESGMVCTLRIEGMKQKHMNQLSVVQTGIATQTTNTVAVTAGDEGSTLSTIFQGGVVEAFIDYASAPSPAFQVTAQTTAIPAAMLISPTSFDGPASVETIMKTIAAKIGVDTVENHGVDITLNGGVYYDGSGLQQIDKCARAANIEYHVGQNALSLWPMTITANSASVLEISAATGMIGYPNYSQYGVLLQSLFLPTLNFRDTIKLVSDYTPAGWDNKNGQLRDAGGTQTIYPPSNGLWVAYKIEHDLQSETPGGQWATTIEAARPEFAGKAMGFGR